MKRATVHIARGVAAAVTVVYVGLWAVVVHNLILGSWRRVFGPKAKE